MSEQTLNTIAFMTMVISLFYRKYRLAETVNSAAARSESASKGAIKECLK